MFISPYPTQHLLTINKLTVYYESCDVLNLLVAILFTWSHYFIHSYFQQRKIFIQYSSNAVQIHTLSTSVEKNLPKFRMVEQVWLHSANLRILEEDIVEKSQQYKRHLRGLVGFKISKNQFFLCTWSSERSYERNLQKNNYN